jgi:hypothetical protein
MVIPTSYKAASRRNDVLEGASIDADLQNRGIEGNSRSRLLNIVVLLED